jgi:hypothetical protein
MDFGTHCFCDVTMFLGHSPLPGAEIMSVISDASSISSKTRGFGSDEMSTQSGSLAKLVLVAGSSAEMI